MVLGSDLLAVDDWVKQPVGSAVYRVHGDMGDAGLLEYRRRRSERLKIPNRSVLRDLLDEVRSPTQSIIEVI